MLFTPLCIRNTVIKNRIVLPPMATFGYGDPHGFVTEKQLTHYGAIARGGAGLIAIEASGVSANVDYGRAPIGAWDDAFIPGLSRLSGHIQSFGATAIDQLQHPGEKWPAFPRFTDLRTARRKALLEDFYLASLRIAKAGFTGVELHAAHGYLLNQFVHYGYAGDVAALAARIREEMPKDFLVGVRMGFSADGPEESLRFAGALCDAGADYLSVSRDMDTPPSAPESFPYAPTVHGAMCIREAVSARVPVFAVGGVRTLSAAENILSLGYADAVCIGRAQLADPGFANKLAHGESPNPCLACPRCKFYQNGADCPARKRLHS